MDTNLLNDRIGRLKDWKQTESLNEILYNALAGLSDYSKARFDNMADEIRAEADAISEPPVIKVAVCSEDNIEKQMFLHPVSIGLPHGCPNYLTTIFAECDFATIQSMLKEKYLAEIHFTDGTLKRTEVALKYSAKYLQKLESLYHVFCLNEILWTTVNCAYFYKFLDVTACGDENGAEQNTGQETAIELNAIESVTMDFREYKKFVSYDKVLLWNVNTVAAKVASVEAKPAYNTVVYSHTVKHLALDENQYIVCPIGDKFHCFRNGQNLQVCTHTKEMEEINFLRVIGNEDEEGPLYLPLVSSKKESGLVGSLARGRNIPTWGEAERIALSMFGSESLMLTEAKALPITREPTYAGQVIAHEKDKKKHMENSIDFNFFVGSNAFLPYRRRLLFSFKSSLDKLWAAEAMFYVLSELQLHFHEFHVIGKLEDYGADTSCPEGSAS